MADKLTVLGAKIRIDSEGYINLTDIAKYKSKEPDQVIRNWLRTAGTLDFMAHWEYLHNEDFNPTEFDGIRIQAGTPAFTLSVKQWVGRTGAIGIKAKPGRYGGTYAHNNIAFEFCSAISAPFKLHLIREWQAFKGLSGPQEIRRELAKANHRLLTSAISDALPSKVAGTARAGAYYASEMDLLNVVLFGQTAKEWKRANPEAKGNIRDHASPLELLILANLETINTYLIRWDTDQEQRLQLLREIAEHQRQVLPDSKAAQRLIRKAKK